MKERDPERVKSNWRRYARTEKGTITLLLNYARDRARRAELPFELDKGWLKPKLRHGLCELSWLSFQRIALGNYRTHPYAPSIDRKIPELGYTKENCRLVLFGLNRAMSDWGEDILFDIASAFVVKHITK